LHALARRLARAALIVLTVTFVALYAVEVLGW
jgi:hypothetical protein